MNHAGNIICRAATALAFILAGYLSICGKVAPAPAFEKIDYAYFQSKCADAPLKDIIANAWGAITREHMDSAVGYYSVAASRYSESLSVDDRHRVAIANVNLGYIWLAWRMNGIEAYPWLMKAKKIADANGFSDISAAVTSNIGQIYLDYNNVPRATEYLKHAFKNVTAQKSHHYYGRALLDILTLSLYTHQKHLSDSVTDVASRYPLPADAPMGRYKPVLIKAMQLYKNGYPDKGAAMLEHADTLLDLETDRERYIAMHLANTAELWIEAGRYDKAVDYFRKSVVLADSCGFYNITERGYAQLVECYRRSGDNTALHEAELRTLRLRDSLFSASRFEAVKNLETTDRINTLNENFRSAQIAADRQKLKLTWMTTAAGILLLLLAVTIISHRRLSAAYREIFKRNMELSGMPAQMGISDHTKTYECDSLSEEKQDQRSAQEETAAHELLEKIRKYMESSREILNPDFSLDRLAEILDTRPKNVSMAINRYSDLNFNSMLARYRVREACRLLADPSTLQNATMESVAESVGYRSRTHFSKIFKDTTGLTPLQFARQARDNF